MAKFFAGYTFVESTARRMLDEPQLSIDFKKEFWHICGEKTEINGIELQVAEFLISNNSKITEELLYKFTETNLKAPSKMALLSLAVTQNIIKDLDKYKAYFKSMGSEYDLWTETKKAKIQDTKENRVIAEFMKNRKLANYTSKNGSLYLRCVKNSANFVYF